MKPSFFSENRNRLADALGGGVAVFSANNLMQRANDAAFLFEQEANFWYLSGIEDPDWWLIIDLTRKKSWLVEPEIDKIHRQFEGGLSQAEAVAISGVSEVVSRDEAKRLLREFAKKHSVVRTLGEHPQKEYFNFIENPAQKNLFIVLERTFNSVIDCRKDLAKLRSIKQPEEISAIKKSIKITSDAFEIVERNMSNFKYEFEIEAEFGYFFKQNNAVHGYDPIVAGGKNACTLHYSKNNQRLKRNSLVLIDVGAKQNGFSADITRTLGVGNPTVRQREVYDRVRQAHEAIIALLAPGLQAADYLTQVDEIMKQALIDLKLIKYFDDKQYRHYFPHAVSHGLGVDVHDSLGGASQFAAGMVLTVEPGIYIPEESIGVRIEDDILITDSGRQNLSAKLSTELS